VKQLELELKKLNLTVEKVELKNNDQDDAILFQKIQCDETLRSISIKQNEFIEPRHHQAYYESNNKTADNIWLKTRIKLQESKPSFAIYSRELIFQSVRITS